MYAFTNRRFQLVEIIVTWMIQNSWPEKSVLLMFQKLQHIAFIQKRAVFPFPFGNKEVYDRRLVLSVRLSNSCSYYSYSYYSYNYGIVFSNNNGF